MIAAYSTRRRVGAVSYRTKVWQMALVVNHATLTARQLAEGFYCPVTIQCIVYNEASSSKEFVYDDEKSEIVRS
jgi:hypothetical protein